MIRATWTQHQFRSVQWQFGFRFGSQDIFFGRQLRRPSRIAVESPDKASSRSEGRLIASQAAQAWKGKPSGTADCLPPRCLAVSPPVGATVELEPSGCPPIGCGGYGGTRSVE